MPRPTGSRNIRPSKSEIENYYRMLTAAARKGDTQAAAKLIELDYLTKQSQRPMQFELARG